MELHCFSILHAYLFPALFFEPPLPGFEGSSPLISVLVPSAGSEPFPKPLLFFSFFSFELLSCVFPLVVVVDFTSVLLEVFEFFCPFPGFEGSIPLTSLLVPSASSEPLPNPLLFLVFLVFVVSVVSSFKIMLLAPDTDSDWLTIVSVSF